MNFDWTITKEDGQQPIGYVFSCNTNADGINVMATIYCFPKLNEFGNNKVCPVTVYWECEKGDITDGFWHCVLDDIGEIIKSKENQLFDNSLAPIQFMMTQQYFVKKLPSLNYFTHGDYHIGN